MRQAIGVLEGIQVRVVLHLVCNDGCANINEVTVVIVVKGLLCVWRCRVLDESSAGP